MNRMKILAIETSCDETAASVVRNGTEILSNVIVSSSAMHEKYGGIVPEVAAREQLTCIIPVIDEALQCIKPTEVSSRKYIEGEIDAIAVTVGPGLIGSLLVGVETAKTIAFVTKKPIIPVNHVLAHMFANFLSSSKKNLSRSQSRDNKISFPAISLVVSGGHTELYIMTSYKNLRWLGGTLDDAAGECFDKSARLLGFGSRGGLAIQEAASQYRISNLPTGLVGVKYQIKLPRPMIGDSTYNFSFSGLKTAILREVNRLKGTKQFNNRTIQQLSFEVQEAITDVLVKKTLLAAKNHHAKSVLLSGGVAANLRLREKFNQQLTTTNIQLFVPPVHLCTDNAAYIASYAFFRGKPSNWHNVTALPDITVEVGKE
jgi:N6-L-threonylcarbamoyladenine synthase